MPGEITVSEGVSGAPVLFESGGISVVEAVPAVWHAFETIMGPKGGAGGCWCMLWRSASKKAFTETCKIDNGAGNKAAIRAAFEAEDPPGLLAFEGETPVGWLSLARRGVLPALTRSRVLSPVDETDVWSITCFLVAKTHRRRGVSVALLRRADHFVATRGGGTLEGYPIASKDSAYPPVYAWTGLEKAFLAAGYKEVARRSETRPIMRKVV